MRTSTAPPPRALEGDGPSDSALADETELSLAEAAALLGVHYMTAYRYVRTGALIARQVDGQWRIGARELADFRGSRQPPRLRRDAKPRAAAPQKGTRRRMALTDRLIAGDELGSWRIIQDALAGGGALDDVYVGLVGAALEDLGHRWETGRATVADEHRAIVVATRLIGRLGARAVRPGRSRGTVVVAAAPGDRHALPSGLLADLLRARGLRVVDLGADTPAEHLAEAAASEDRLLGVGICVTAEPDPAGVEQLRAAVCSVRERCGAPVLLGGGALGGDLLVDVPCDHRSSDAFEAIAWFDSLAAPQRARAAR